MRVVAFTSGWTVPSSRFRVRQFVPPLEARGVTVSEHPSEPGKYDPVPFGVPKFLFDRKRLKSRTKWFDEAAGADVVWLEREFLVGRRSEELAVGSAARRVFDVDDAIFLSGEKGYSEEIAAGCALGFLALRHRSVWWGVALHYGIAVTMDLLSIANNGYIIHGGE